jgi:hypothetical protein
VALLASFHAAIAGHVTLAQPASSPVTDHAVGYYDSERGRVTLVGGPGDASDNRDSVWTWSGERWEPVTRDGPPGRVNAGAAFDARRRRAVITGGSRKSGPGATWQVVGDSWESAQNSWRQSGEIPPRDHHALVEGPDGNILMFGGIPPNRSAPWPADTWRLADDKWQRVSEEGPAARGRTALAYDRRRQRVVLFGGVSAPGGPNGSQTFLGDTWTWDGRRWQQAAAGGPPGRYAHGMVYDEGAGVVLLYSGAAAHKNAPLSDMWQWDGERWTEIRLTGPTPGHRYQPVMVYDRARGTTVLYGGISGSNDTWEWDRKQWRRIAPPPAPVAIAASSRSR